MFIATSFVKVLRRPLESAQYASADYRKVVQSTGFRASMSRKADCYDNAPMESFFHTLKTELVHHRQYATREEAKRDIFAYIEGYYNRASEHPSVYVVEEKRLC
jgi:transposase InsO family protein